MKIIETGAFDNCPIETLFIDTTTIPNLDFIRNSLKNLTIGDNVTWVSDEKFKQFINLKSVKIGSSVTGIGFNAFFGCETLTSVTIPNSVTSISFYAFSGCPIESLYIDMTTIPDFYFKKSFLKNLTIGDNVTRISGTFRNCSSLISVTIPNSVTTIDSYEFSDCTSLTSVTIPDSVTSIGSGVFRGCPNLTIYCYKDSTAHKYAITNNIPFVLLDSDNPPVTTTPTTTTQPPDTTTSPTITNIPPTTTTPSTTTTPPTSRKGVISKQGIESGKPTIFCTLEILKALIGMPSQATDNPAALITEVSQKKGQPTIFDALEILKYLVGINGEH